LKEGVPLPLINANKPISDPNAIPEGVKLSGDEIVHIISERLPQHSHIKLVKLQTLNH
jgi:hypothetical protein